MSRKAKRGRAKQAAPAPVAAPIPQTQTSASGRPCEDELTLICERLKPAHRQFADAYLRGVMGTKAADLAGYKDRGTGFRLLRNPDVRRYIVLMQREMAVASRVSLNTLVDHLWRIVADPTATQKRRDQAVLQLTRIFTATGNIRSSLEAGPAPATTDGLSDPLIGSIEERILGVRRQPQLSQADDDEEQGP